MNASLTAVTGALHMLAALLECNGLGRAAGPGGVHCRQRVAGPIL